MDPSEAATTAATTFPTVQRITPNTPSQDPLHATTLFLAGPTEVPWREEFVSLLEQHLRDQKHHHHHHHHHHHRQQQPPADPTPAAAVVSGGITVFDPFQPAWDGTWREDYGADPRFRAQADWELDRQEAATLVVVFFDERARAPVTLLELGLCARSGRAVVGCQAGFWKRGSVHAVCARLGVPLEDTLEGLTGRVVAVLNGRTDGAV